jgi:hypothetical protein
MATTAIQSSTSSTAIRPGASSKDQLRHLYRFMAPRDFVASRRELTAAGFSPTRIENWVKSGRLVRIARGVYSYGRDVETVGAARRAALLVAGPGSALVGRSACELLRIVTPKAGIPNLIEVGSPHGQARQFRGCSPAFRYATIKVVRRRFEPIDLRMNGGIQVARAAMALSDLAARGRDREVRFAFLEACRLGLFEKQDLEYCLSRLFHRRGSAKLRPYLLLWVPELKQIKSVLEGWFLLVWIERGYPMPMVNNKVFGWEVDFFWPLDQFALEMDGDAFHSDPVQKKLDLEKQRFLESNGLEVRRLTFKVFERDPVGEVDRIARRLGYC